MQRSLCCHKISPSHTGVVSKRLNLSYNFILSSGNPITLVFDPLHRYPIPRGAPLAGLKLNGGGKNLRISTEIAVYLGNGAR